MTYYDPELRELERENARLRNEERKRRLREENERLRSLLGLWDTTVPVRRPRRWPEHEDFLTYC